MYNKGEDMVCMFIIKIVPNAKTQKMAPTQDYLIWSLIHWNLAKYNPA